MRRMIGERASWAEIFRILHATPGEPAADLQSYNEYGLCDETVKKYEIPEAEARPCSWPSSSTTSPPRPAWTA